ncbi:unnamed protein product [Chilo suppressalis]|uniref:Uncharacterized protein n=1 Tax=Chilo suppressalis TaxID=168631 RepID=A0ABN8AWH8_CHISP|nr:unnamed protein product [Chilo suppressalis]
MPSRIVNQEERSKDGPEPLPDASEDERTVTITRRESKEEETILEILEETYALRNELDDEADELLKNDQKRREKADALAKRMEAAVGEYAEIARPERCADLKVSGLDESVTPEEVREAIAKKGGCAEREITAGELHPGPGGMRGTLVRCPAWAAKKVAEGKLRVGWNLAKRPMWDTEPLSPPMPPGPGYTPPAVTAL